VLCTGCVQGDEDAELARPICFFFIPSYTNTIFLEINLCV
jgi:hypothetical protein